MNIKIIIKKNIILMTIKFIEESCIIIHVNPITVGNFAFLFTCTPVGRTSDSMMVPT